MSAQLLTPAKTKWEFCPLRRHKNANSESHKCTNQMSTQIRPVPNNPKHARDMLRNLVSSCPPKVLMCMYLPARSLEIKLMSLHCIHFIPDDLCNKSRGYRWNENCFWGRFSYTFCQLIVRSSDSELVATNKPLWSRAELCPFYWR